VAAYQVICQACYRLSSGRPFVCWFGRTYIVVVVVVVFFTFLKRSIAFFLLACYGRI